MKFVSFPVVLACIAVSVSMTLAFAGPGSAQQDQPSVEQWEHLALTHDDAGLSKDLSQQIVRLGDQGWELVCVTPVTKDGSTVTTRYYFKRPK